MTEGPPRSTNADGRGGGQDGGAAAVRAIDRCAYFDGNAFACGALAVSREGARLSLPPGAPIPAARSGVRLKVRLPSGFWIVGDALVSGRPGKLLGRSGPLELEWTRVASEDRRILEEAACDALGVAEELSANLQIKHWVESDEPDALAIALGGHLLEPDCQTLDAQLGAILVKRRAGGTKIFLNAVGFRASPAPSLRRLRRVFGRLGAHGGVLGLVTLGESVAATQLRRVLRDAGLGESLVACRSIDDARSLWPRCLLAHDAPMA